MRFLDTNIFVRHLAQDDAVRAAACRDLLSKVESGEEVVVTSGMVISEVVFLLESPRSYALPRDMVRQMFEPLLDLRGMRIPDKALYKRAFELHCAENIDFPDAYNAAYMEANGISEVYSYDRDFDRVEGIRRVEPGESLT